MIKIFTALVLTLFFISNASSHENLHILTEDYAPFGYLENGELVGIGPEIIKEMSKHIGEEAPEIEVLPWKRAYLKIQKEENVALFSMTKISEREDLFKWVGPLYSMQEYFFAAKGYDHIINSLEDAKKASSILTQAGGASETYFKSLGFENIVTSFNDEKQVKMLMEKRVELVAATDAMIVFQLNANGLSSDVVKPVFNIKKADLYLAFSMKTDEKIVEKWREALLLIQQNGAWDKIISKYLIASIS